jgi:hypothetical protein
MRDLPDFYQRKERMRSQRLLKNRISLLFKGNMLIVTMLMANMFMVRMVV